jgi:RNA polymerase sigma-70 factor (ECF subfamily)
MDEEAKDLQSLVTEARAGDVGAFEALYRRHHMGIFTFVHSQIRDRELAADLTQQTFVRAWESLARLRQAGAFRGWLHRIAANLVRDEVKSGRARLEVSASSLGDADPLVTAADPADDLSAEALAAKDLQRAVRDAIASLPAQQRAVVVMHHLEGAPVSEIAGALGVRPGTVMSRLARAREALRKQLAPYVEADDD